MRPLERNYSSYNYFVESKPRNGFRAAPTSKHNKQKRRHH